MPTKCHHPRLRPAFLPACVLFLGLFPFSPALSFRLHDSKLLDGSRLRPQRRGVRGVRGVEAPELTALSSEVSPSSRCTSSGVRSPPLSEVEGKLGVLFLNLGGPLNLEGVEPFLYNLFADGEIIRLPKGLKWLQPLIAFVISKARAPSSREKYAAIGGGSPILEYTTQQAAAVERLLKSRGIRDVEAFVGMRYAEPFAESVVKEMLQSGVKRAVVVPLYPHYSISTSKSALLSLMSERSFLGLPHTVVPHWYQREGFVEAVQGLIKKEILSIPREAREKEGVHVLFTAHGVPESYIEEGDPYKDQMEHSVALIAEKVQRSVPSSRMPLSHSLSFQSRVGPVTWLQPYTDDEIKKLAEEGVRNLIVVPISFVSEHLETLEEIDQEYREVAEEAGIRSVNWGGGSVCWGVLKRKEKRKGEDAVKSDERDIQFIRPHTNLSSSNGLWKTKSVPHLFSFCVILVDASTLRVRKIFCD
uniref:Ferrochelatase n=1 Tax=Chromera velia CCMP2878 TaxID=1169474 RepID=A0A0G4FR07_9ALVE|eukprot:Cvel_18167.t1-p1 / transcript=Cvel_18167.t1 / gene=Cvel_18167 / organism=Chromera_velia_CCMP2878 / gene_product=Ferrochelatase-2, chloroplastic, putative / transcript_product=Ferrochelatase-2, chloroplastic, putative / location=Cvel_scaffold1490:80-3304(-) / protein_length=473 / sequence_SO=supercontig / SO=protein_coding / is_pseudo=false